MENNITLAERKEVKEFFDVVKTSNDFCMLLDFCQDLLFPNPIIRISKHLLETLAHPSSKNRYHSFNIPKKNGDLRTIHAPNGELKVLLQCVNLVLSCVYTPHEAAYGFVENRSIANNASLHINKNYVFNQDLKDFFPSIEIGRILNRFNFPPFNLSKENGREQIGNYIAWLACENMLVERLVDGQHQKTVRRVLPQGSPVSPTLTNIICERLDRKLTGAAKKFGAVYSRYADDITFSSMHNIYQDGSEFRAEIEKIIKEQYFEIKESKTRLQKSNVRQEVTGITVNEKINVTKSYVKRVRLWLNMWEKYGTDKAFQLFLIGYKKDKGYVKKIGSTPFFMEAVIEGKLNYLKMIKGESDSTYLGLKKRLEKLSLRNKATDLIIDTWEQDGINKAMTIFYANKGFVKNNRINLAEIF